MALADFLAELTTGQEHPKYSRLLQLSGLSSDEVFELKIAWTSVPPERRRDMMGKLVELCDENLELDFSSVFRASLEDPDEDVRSTATRGLWECDDRSVIRPLIALLSDDPSPRVRAAAAVALGKFAALAQDGKLLSRDSDRIRQALMGIIGEEGDDLEVRRRAIEAVAHYDLPETGDIIRQAHESGVPRLKQSSIYAMGRSSNTQWLPTVLAEMNDESPAIRYEAASAAGQLGDESTVPHLVHLIQDDDSQVQLAAVRALGTVGGPLAKSALEQCREIGDEALEAAAEGALSEIEFDEDPLGFRPVHSS